MKEFFKYVLATITGMLLMGILVCGMFFMMMVSAMMAGEQKPSLHDDSVLHLQLNGMLTERATSDPMSFLLGSSDMESIGLNDMVKALKVAAKDKHIKGVYLEAGVLGADFASIQELRKAILDFKKSGKFVYAYGDAYTQGCYYVCSAADKLYLNPSGLIEWQGLASQPMFYKDLLEKVGVKMQVFKVGTYKSAVEPFTRTDMSPENREQVQVFIDDIWKNVIADVAQGRKLSADTLNAYANRYVSFAAPEEFVKLKMVDALYYIDQMRDELRKAIGNKTVHLVAASDVARLYEETAETSDHVAVYFAEGTIVDEVASRFGGMRESQIVGSKVVEDLDKLASDEHVKAVVLRINSGGGSAYASEQMWRAIQLLKKKKPVVVSMSGMAASGGYYMSCGADYIFAEPTTLTGSIGIFGMVPDATGLLTDKLGLHFDIVKTNEAADFGAMGRPFNANEAAAMQQHVERGYALFLKRVAEGRKMSVADVDKIAQGRVWTGSAALPLKLVDKMGTLDDAIAEAATRGKMKDKTQFRSYPAPAPWFEDLMDKQKEQYIERELRAVLGANYTTLTFLSNLQGRARLQARIPFDPNFVGM